MNASRAERRSPGLAALLAAVMAAGGVGAAFAQTSTGPLVVPAPSSPSISQPPSSPAPSASPERAAPASPRALTPRKLSPAGAARQSSGTTSGAAAPAAPGTPTAPSGITVDRLAAVDPDSVGILGSADGGFPADLWKGTPYALVAPLLKEFPVAQPSATLRNLSRRLLASAATLPEGDHEAGALVARRAEILAQMGDFDAATRLIEAAPAQVDSDALAWTEFRVRLLSGDDARACGVASARIDKSATARWQKAMVFCQLAGGQKQPAGLTLALLHDAGENDPPFMQLADAMVAGTPPTLDSLPQPNALTLAMIRIAKIKLPKDAMGTGQPGLLRAIAAMPGIDLEQRLDAAERATATGALSLDALRDIYSKVTFEERERTAPIKATESLSGPRSRALLYQTARAQPILTAKAEAVAQAFKLAHTGGRFTLAARVFAPIIAGIPASSDNAWFAPQAIRALLLSDTPQAATPWVDVVRSAARFRPEDANALIRLTPLVYIARMDTDQPLEAALGQWWEVAKGDENILDQATEVLILLDAVGAKLPARAWTQVLDGSPHDVATVPRAPLWFMLERASAAGRLGEGVLTAIVSLGEGSVDEASPLVLHHVISAFKALKLADEGRRLAVEAAIEGGL